MHLKIYKPINILLIILLSLGALYLLVLILKIDLGHFTYNKNYCFNAVLNEKEKWNLSVFINSDKVKSNVAKDIYHNYSNKYQGVDCSTLSSKETEEYKKYNELFGIHYSESVYLKARYSGEMGGDDRYIVTERDLCEYTHLIVQDLERDVQKKCIRPPLFKQR